MPTNPFISARELRHDGQLIIKTVSPQYPLISPDGLYAALFDANKLQNNDQMQKMYLRVYSLTSKAWVDFPGNERPIAWVPAAPDAK